MIATNRTRLTVRNRLAHGASSSIGRALVCGTSGYGFEPREAPQSQGGGTVPSAFIYFAGLAPPHLQACEPGVTAQVAGSESRAEASNRPLHPE